jgi:hypothetical protein
LRGTDQNSNEDANDKKMSNLNLAEQLTWLREHQQEGLLNGFSYGPTCSSHLLPYETSSKQVFSFLHEQQLSAISTLGSLGATELQSFRKQDIPQYTSVPTVSMNPASTLLGCDDIPDSAFLEIDLDSTSHFIHLILFCSSYEIMW